MKIWPTPAGNHRGALRGNARGARVGRERWRWRSPSPVYRALVGDESVVVEGAQSFAVLDRSARLLFSHPLRESERPVALVGEVVVVQREATLTAYAGRSTAWVHELPEPVHAVGVTPDDELVVWTVEERGWLRSGRVWRFAADGTLRWSCDHPFRLGGHPLHAAVVCDDDGRIYTGACERHGDGVSGDDVARGGIAMFEGGEPRWTHPCAPGMTVAADQGVMYERFDVHALAPDGTPRWSVRTRDCPLLPVEGLEVGLRHDARLRDWPARIDAGPRGGGTVLHGVSDPEGWSWYGRVRPDTFDVEAIFALDPGPAFAWSIPVRADRSSQAVLAVGPDETVLYADRSELVAVG